MTRTGPPLPSDEAARLAALRRYDILDAPPDGAFDRIAAIAAHRFGVPIAIICLFEAGLDSSFPSSACVRADFIDASLDPRTFADPLFAKELGLHFHAAAPLTTRDGQELGELCVIDRAPRVLTPEEMADLRDLAHIVMDEMELWLAARRAVEQGVLMAREIDHRVTNSLQFIAGMLAIQAAAAGAPDGARELRAAAGRVRAVARVHHHFYAEEQTATVCGTAFLRRLCEDLSQILGREIDILGDELEVPSITLQPIGLLVHELATNAAKHGGGRITIRLREEDGMGTLSVCDEGPGLPPGFDCNRTRGLGLRIATGLAQQLGGTMRAGANPSGTGSCFSTCFPIRRPRLSIASAPI